MLRLVFAALLAVAALGCATPYAIHLKDGQVLHATDEPEYDKRSGFYVFEDAYGKQVHVNKDDIVKMEAD
jgi:hypothetical protein